MFDDPTEQDIEGLRDAARELTNDRQSVRVSPKPGAPRWLVGEFTMPSQPQYAAVARIDRCVAFQNLNRIDSAIGFPKDAPRARNRSRKKKGDRAT
jgi:hypothetical protein